MSGHALKFPSALERIWANGPQEGLRLVTAVEDAVEQSYDPSRCPMRHRTTAEDKRRAAICIGLVELLYDHPFHWHVARIIDHLPRFLVEKLENSNWQPRFRGGMWSPAAQLKTPA